jgi:hypothetical protein
MYWEFGDNIQATITNPEDPNQQASLRGVYIPYLEAQDRGDKTVVSSYGGLNSAYKRVAEAVENLRGARAIQGVQGQTAQAKA